MRSVVRQWVLMVAMVATLTATACGGETVEEEQNKGEPVIFAHYYGWYNPDQWSQPITEDPVLGLYDSLDSAVIAQHIEWGKRAGVTAFSVSWHGKGSITDAHLKNHLKPAVDSQLAEDTAMRFMILFETPDILDVSHGSVIDFDEEFSPAMSRGDKFLEEMSYLADSYFDSAGYYKIDQQPVVFIYLMRDVINHQIYFNTLKSSMEAMGFDLYLIGDVIHWQNPVGGRTVQHSRPADWDFYKANFKAISGYNLYDPSRYPANGMEDRFLSDVEAHWGIWEAHINAHGLRFVPFIIPGYDDRNLRGSDRPILGRDGGQFYRQHWAMAEPFINSDVPHVAITSFNEWHEGTEIEPSNRYGESYLDSTEELSRRQKYPSASDNIQEHIHQAVGYLESVRDESLGLLYESPDGMQTIEGISWQLNQIYWAQTDNFLTALALRPHNRVLSDSIQATIASYQVPSASKPNAITVLSGRTIPEGAAVARTVIEVTGDDHVIVTEVQDGVDISDWEMYGNLLALQSLNQWLRGNEREALRLYSLLLGMWDGHGINDKATRVDGQYAVYKIALTLLLSKVYEDDLSEAAAMEHVMWSAQAESGGIRTDLDASTFAVGGYTNTETTSLVILAYDRALIQSLRSAGLQAQ